MGYSLALSKCNTQGFSRPKSFLVRYNPSSPYLELLCNDYADAARRLLRIASCLASMWCRSNYDMLFGSKASAGQGDHFVASDGVGGDFWS